MITSNASDSIISRDGSSRSTCRPPSITRPRSILVRAVPAFLKSAAAPGLVNNPLKDLPGAQHRNFLTVSGVY
jgi:hypothetical protein